MNKMLMNIRRKYSYNFLIIDVIYFNFYINNDKLGTYENCIRLITFV